jgi:hypothetical protein
MQQIEKGKKGTGLSRQGTKGSKGSSKDINTQATTMTQDVESDQIDITLSPSMERKLERVLILTS